MGEGTIELGQRYQIEELDKECALAYNALKKITPNHSLLKFFKNITHGGCLGDYVEGQAELFISTFNKKINNKKESEARTILTNYHNAMVKEISSIFDEEHLNSWPSQPYQPIKD